MIAYKFLRAGAIGRFSGLRWPAPGTWVQPSAPTERGVSACRVRDLPFWLSDELWEIELADPVATGPHKLVAPAARLRTRIEAWTPACAEEYAGACAAHLRALAVEALGSGAPAPLQRAATVAELVAAVQDLGEMPSNVRAALVVLGTSALRSAPGGPALVAYVIAHAVDRLDPVAGYASERAWQAAWLARRLELAPTAADGA